MFRDWNGTKGNFFSLILIFGYCEAVCSHFSSIGKNCAKKVIHGNFFRDHPIFYAPFWQRRSRSLTNRFCCKHAFFLQCFLHRKIHCWWHFYKYFFFFLSLDNSFCVKWHINNALQLEFFVFHNNLLYVGFLLRTLIFVFQSNVTFWLFFLKQKRVISGEVSWLFRKGWQWLLRVEF